MLVSMHRMAVAVTAITEKWFRYLSHHPNTTSSTAMMLWFFFLNMQLTVGKISIRQKIIFPSVMSKLYSWNIQHVIKFYKESSLFTVVKWNWILGSNSFQKIFTCMNLWWRIWKFHKLEQYVFSASSISDSCQPNANKP